jgi:hypothetical protein
VALWLLQDELAAERGQGPMPLWWFWLLVTVAFIAVIIWLLRRMGPGGPWFY